MKKIVLALTGASGMPYGLELVRQFKSHGFELHLVVSDAAQTVLSLETPDFESVTSMADYIYNQKQLGAPISSGSFIHSGMVVCPCSMASLSAIASGLGSNLIHRAADVTLKEKRPLVLVPREMPYNRTHLKNMLRAHDSGAVILPPCPGFYHSPDSIHDLVKHVAGKILDSLGIENSLFNRWEGIV